MELERYPEVKKAVEAVMDCVCDDRDADGLYYMELHIDPNDDMELENDEIMKILASDSPMESLYNTVDQNLFSFDNFPYLLQALQNNESVKSAAADTDIDLDTALHEYLLQSFYNTVPYDYFLDQEVNIDIIVDSGDMNYGFASNSFAHSYYGSIDEPVPEESSLLWLCRQQGISSDRLNATLRKGSAFDPQTLDLFEKRNRLLEELRNLGWNHFGGKLHIGTYGKYKDLVDKIKNLDKRIQYKQVVLQENTISHTKYQKLLAARGQTNPFSSEDSFLLRQNDVINAIQNKLYEFLEEKARHQQAIDTDPNFSRISEIESSLSYINVQLQEMGSHQEFHDNTFIDSILEESRSVTTGTNALTFLVSMPLKEAIQLNEVIRAEEEMNDYLRPEHRSGKSFITLSKDTVCGLYDFENGAGGLFEIHLLNTVDLPVKFIHSANADGYAGHSIRDIYGEIDYAQNALVDIQSILPDKLSLDVQIAEAACKSVVVSNVSQLQKAEFTR